MERKRTRHLYYSFLIIFILDLLSLASCHKLALPPVFKPPIDTTEVPPHDTTSTRPEPFNPDSPIASGYELDLNKDGVNDIRFKIFYSAKARNGTECPPGLRAAAYVSPIPASNSKIAIRATGFARGIDSLDIINEHLSYWSNDSLQTLARGNYITYCYSEGGDWSHNQIKYLPVKLSSNHKSYYGWVRIRVAVDPFRKTFRVYIRGFGYHTKAGSSIRAGREN